MKAAIIACALFLGACASTPPEPVVKTQRVDVPVVVSCKPDIGSEPAYPDTPQTITTAPDIFVRVQLLLAGRLARIQREAELTAALAACE